MIGKIMRENMSRANLATLRAAGFRAGSSALGQQALKGVICCLVVIADIIFLFSITILTEN
jgi:hypothetical protein